MAFVLVQQAKSFLADREMSQVDRVTGNPNAASHGRGLFVVLEGGEGAGKTTQWTRLADTLRSVGQEVVAVREPGGTAAGDVIRSLLLDPEASLTDVAEALLFAASRAQLVRSVIAPALERGAIVLVDRYLLSTYAYQGAGRGLPLGSLRCMNELAIEGCTPDVTLLLFVPENVARSRLDARGGTDRLEAEGVAFHERVGLAFEKAVSDEWQKQHPEVGPVVAIAGDGEAHAVTMRCMNVLVERWPARFAAAADVSLHSS